MHEVMPTGNSPFETMEGDIPCVVLPSQLNPEQVSYDDHRSVSNESACVQTGETLQRVSHGERDCQVVCPQYQARPRFSAIGGPFGRTSAGRKSSAGSCA